MGEGGGGISSTKNGNRSTTFGQDCSYLHGVKLQSVKDNRRFPFCVQACNA